MAPSFHIMSTIHNLLRKWEALNIEQVYDDAIQDTATEALELQQEQMYAGKLKDGSEITPAYVPYTITKKREKGQPYDRVTLFDEGNFYRGQNVKAIGGGAAYIGSSDEKTAKIEWKYRGIWGLGGQYLRDYYSVLKPIANSRIENITGLKFQ